jgi:hypothetical protein
MAQTMSSGRFEIKQYIFFAAIPLLLLLCAYTSSNAQVLHNGQGNDIKPFEADIFNSNFSMAYSVLIVLTEKELKIILKSGLIGEKDSLLFYKALALSDTLLQISNLNLSELKEYYSNPCIDDGSQITVIIKKGGKEKSVHLSNYYQDYIGKIIYLANSFVPKKYRVWYDKERLVLGYKRCKGIK